MCAQGPKTSARAPQTPHAPHAPPSKQPHPKHRATPQVIRDLTPGARYRFDVQSYSTSFDAGGASSFAFSLPAQFAPPRQALAFTPRGLRASVYYGEAQASPFGGAHLCDTECARADWRRPPRASPCRLAPPDPLAPHPPAAAALGPRAGRQLLCCLPLRRILRAQPGDPVHNNLPRRRAARPARGPARGGGRAGARCGASASAPPLAASRACAARAGAGATCRFLSAASRSAAPRPPPHPPPPSQHTRRRCRARSGPTPPASTSRCPIPRAATTTPTTARGEAAPNDKPT